MDLRAELELQYLKIECLKKKENKQLDEDLIEMTINDDDARKKFQQHAQIKMTREFQKGAATNGFMENRSKV